MEWCVRPNELAHLKSLHNGSADYAIAIPGSMEAMHGASALPCDDDRDPIGPMDRVPVDNRISRRSYSSIRLFGRSESTFYGEDVDPPAWAILGTPMGRKKYSQ
jgi:hypothetical protein